MFSKRQILFAALTLSLPVAVIGMENDTSRHTKKHKSNKSAEDIDYGKALNSIVKTEFNGNDDIKSKLAPFTTKRIPTDVLTQQADNMINFVKDQEQNEQDMLRLGTWLTNQRKTITNTKTWGIWMDELRGVMLRKINDQCDHIERKRALLVMAVIFDIALDLEPDQECLTPLIQNSTSIIKQADTWIPTFSELLPLFSFTRYR